MSTYEYSLIYMLPVVDDMDLFIDRFEDDAECDDAIIGLSENGRLTLSFESDGDSVSDLIKQSIQRISKHIPEAQLVEVSPDLVSLTELAAMLEVTRQAARKMWEKNTGNNFPTPVKYGNGKSPIWNMASVLHWMDNSNNYAIPVGMLDVAKAAMRENLINAHEKLAILGVEVEPVSSAPLYVTSPLRVGDTVDPQTSGDLLSDALPSLIFRQPSLIKSWPEMIESSDSLASSTVH